MHSQIYSGLSLIFAILRNFRVAGAKGSFCARRANIIFFIQSVKKSHFRTLFRSKNAENRACVTSTNFITIIFGV